MDSKGWKTSEFWLSMAAVLVAYLIGTSLSTDYALIGKLLVMAAAVLESLGYTASRAVVKKERLRQQLSTTRSPKR